MSERIGEVKRREAHLVSENLQLRRPRHDSSTLRQHLRLPEATGLPLIFLPNRISRPKLSLPLLLLLRLFSVNEDRESSSFPVVGLGICRGERSSSGCSRKGAESGSRGSSGGGSGKGSRGGEGGRVWESSRREHSNLEGFVSLQESFERFGFSVDS